MLPAAMKIWVIIGIAVAGLGLLSMGALGGLLYYAAYPIFAPAYGDLNDWRGDDVWPAMIMIGMLWSVSFPLAGWANRRLAARGAPLWRRRAVCVALLWLGAVAVWGLALATMTIQVPPR